MNFNPVATFPESWKTTVTVRRGGTDRWGDPLPGQEHSEPGCLVGWRSTADPVDRSELTSDDAVIYAEPGCDFRSGDRIIIPDGPWPAGEFWVDGSPKRWPMGVEIPIRRGTTSRG